MHLLLKYRKIVWVLMLLLIAVGVFTYIQLPKRDIPEINQELAAISVVYPGATPATMEKAITNPIEDALDGIDGITDLNSTSTNGFVNVTAVLDGASDATTTYQAINQAINDVKGQFPTEVRSVSVNTDLIQANVETYHLLSRDLDPLLNLRPTIDQFVEDLLAINGVKGIDLRGLPGERLSVSIEPELLARYQLQPNAIIETLSETLSPTALGSEEKDGELVSLSLPGYQSLEDLNETIVTTNENGPIRLKDVTTITRDTAAIDTYIHQDGQYALSLTVQAEDGINIQSLEAPLNAATTAFEESLPPDVSLNTYFSQLNIIDDVYASLLQSLFISLIAVMVIMILGLPISSAIIVALAIPLSMVIGLIPLPYNGVDLNQISIIGIIVAIGILVDDAIVVNDNIERRFRLGDNALDGVLNGIKEVRVSIITSTLLIAFSFVPLTFLSGSNGDFIRALPLALVYTVLASTLLALTFMPTLRFALKQRKDAQPTRSGLLSGLFDKLSDVYADKVIPFSLKRPLLTIALTFVMTLAMLSTFFIVPFEFFPAAEREEVTITARLDEGTTLEATRERLIAIEEYLNEQAPEVTETTSYAGRGLPAIFGSTLTNSGENTGQIVARVDLSSTKVLDFIDHYEQDLRQQFSDVQLELSTIVSGPPAGPDVALDIQGEDLTTLTTYANDLSAKLDALDSTKLVKSNAVTKPVIELNIDEPALFNYGFTRQQVEGLMQLANIGAPIGTFDNGKDRLPVNVTYNDGDPDGLALSALELASFSGESPVPTIVPLADFISEERNEQISAINHINGERTVTLAIFSDGDDFARDLDAVLNDFEETLPTGITIVETGEQASQTAFFLEVGKLFLVVLFLIYMTLAIQFNSLTTPLLVSATIVLAVSGAGLGLLISGEPLSFLAVLGIVALSGVIVRNAILLIEFIEQNRDQYSSVHEAFIEAGRQRLRPILLTTLTSMAALIPIIITGDVLFKPLAVSIVYGILFATLLTLLSIPPLYLLLVRARTRKDKQAS